MKAAGHRCLIRSSDVSLGAFWNKSELPASMLMLTGQGGAGVDTRALAVSEERVCSCPLKEYLVREGTIAPESADSSHTVRTSP